jgi:3-polyprenyl-4-hydroxybenzoate decarboxylase
MRITREVDADMESAAITRRSYELRSHGPLFENIQRRAARVPGLRRPGRPVLTRRRTGCTNRVLEQDRIIANTHTATRRPRPGRTTCRPVTSCPT